MLRRGVADPLIRDHRRPVCSERFHVAGHHLHGRRIGELPNEILDRAKRRAFAPEPEPRHVRQVPGFRGLGRAGIDDAQFRQLILEPDHRQPGLGRLPKRARQRVGRSMAFIEHHIPVIAQPISNLFQPGLAFLGLGDQGRVAGENHAALHLCIQSVVGPKLVQLI